MKVNLLIVAALALSCAVAVAQQQPRSSEALSFASRDGNCPSGYYLSGGFCTPLNRDSRPAVPRPPGASCPSGWYSSGSGCVKL